MEKGTGSQASRRQQANKPEETGLNRQAVITSGLAQPGPVPVLSVGLDFGTSMSAIAFKLPRNNEPEVIHNFPARDRANPPDPSNRSSEAPSLIELSAGRHVTGDELFVQRRT